ncbi:hypothetical protein BD779DRAFT_1673506 [Infundibulicybe gibba]|nr:hypothetical protein BD779DRAFT_1673506 [Infundibulicybe gibba]
MSRPLLWPRKVFFYPIGNTPAVCLTDTLPPEQRADILLLGCGDPRNVLYTTFCDLGADRQIDVTCCDVDPAILARNVFVYTLLSDGNLNSLLPTIWDVFYHFYIDDKSLALISSHCKRLLDLSSTLDRWHGSKYGGFLRICTHHTLMELQRHWREYLETANASPAEKKGLSDLFAAGMKEVRARKLFCGLTLRAAGPLWPTVEAAGQNLYQHFWTNGVTGTKATVSSGQLYANPLFAYSLVGKGFHTHYGTEPVSSFHLMIPLASNPTGPTNSQDLVDFAKSEFSTWCRAFANHVKNRKITIRLFAGDALSFAHALHYYSKTGDPETHVYTSSWGNSLIKLHREDYSDTGNAPSGFNVIDTSNLSDHLGILNLLISCLPILQASAFATLQTNTLHPNLNTSLDRLCGDFAALSSLLGVTSKTHVSEFATHFSGSELITESQLHERMSWKWTEFISSTVNPTRCNVTLEFDAKQLAIFLFNIYQQMFAEESKPGADVVKIVYSRASFSFLLLAVMTRTRQIWSDVLSHLILLIGSNRKLLFGVYKYQDFCCQLHIHNLHSVESIRDPAFLGSQTDLSLFKNHPTIPPLTCIVLRVPREKISVIEKMHTGTPILHCQVFGPGFLDMFSSIRPTLGDIDATRADTVIAVNDDPQGWSGTSPLVVSFWVPSWILTVDPSHTGIALSFQPTPDTVYSFSPKLGDELCIFAASLQDREHVFISSQRPGNEREFKFHKKTSPSKDATGPSLSTALVQVALDPAAQKISRFTLRKDVTDDAARRSLSGRAAVTTTQISSCALRVAFKNHNMIFTFPFPIDGSKAITRIARSSFYIEVEVPISGPRRSGGFMFQRFPIIKEGITPTIWNIPYVKLDLMPRLEDPQKLEWLAFLMQHAFTMEERVTLGDRKRGALSTIKKAISGMLFHAAGIPDQPPKKWFYFTEAKSARVYAILFVDGLRLDPASQTVVIDAFALSLTYAVTRKIRAKLEDPEDIMRTNTDLFEADVWSHLLPIFAERCRTWKHTAKCEYISGNIPLSTDPEDDPLCSCGRGKGVSFSDEWNEWNEFASLFTRIAISPLFPPHTVDILGHAGHPTRGKMTGSRNSPSAPPACCAACNGSGKPGLLTCSACKKIKYCSAACQKSHWAMHKARCKTSVKGA